jgi:hypothetical protein
VNSIKRLPTACDSHCGPSAFAAGTALHAPKLPFCDSQGRFEIGSVQRASSGGGANTTLINFILVNAPSSTNEFPFVAEGLDHNQNYDATQVTGK